MYIYIERANKNTECRRIIISPIHKKLDEVHRALMLWGPGVALARAAAIIWAYVILPLNLKLLRRVISMICNVSFVLVFVRLVRLTTERWLLTYKVFPPRNRGIIDRYIRKNSKIKPYILIIIIII